jgi:hypothetical protein
VARWNSFAALTAAELANDDVLPVSDTSAVEGSRSRVVQLGSLKLARVRSYAANFTLDDDLDLGAHVRVTAVATVTIPADLPVGWSCVIENATVGDVVDLAEALGVTLLSAGVSVSPGKWVGLQVVNTDVVSAVGAFTEEAAAVAPPVMLTSAGQPIVVEILSPPVSVAVAEPPPPVATAPGIDLHPLIADAAERIVAGV